MQRVLLFLLVVAGAGCANDDGAEPPPPSCEAAATWAAGPPLPEGATQETAVVSLSGKVYVLGGMSGRTGVKAAVQIFDPATCSWSLGPALPHAAHHINAAVSSDTIYVAGMLAGPDFSPSGMSWAWAPGRDSAWRALPLLPGFSGRGSSATGVIGDQLIVAGGISGNAVATVHALTISTQTWSTLPPLPAPTDHGCGAVVDGKLYVIGGREGAVASVKNQVLEYAPGGAWRARAPMPTPRGGVACAVAGDRIIVVGGEGNVVDPYGVFDHVEAYRPSTDTWETLPPLPRGRHGMGAAAIGDRLYVPGGAMRAGLAPTATFEILTL